VERDWELAALEQTLAEARADSGGAIFIEAHAGLGKSRLLMAAADIARHANMLVLQARGNELERDFPFGIATQLFEPLWLASDAEERKALLAGPARLAAELLSTRNVDALSEAYGRHYPVIHGLFRLTDNLVSRHPHDAPNRAIAMLVDDTHWSDSLSLRFLAYLAERIEELPVAIVLAARPGEECADAQALATLRRVATLLRPGSLSLDGVTSVVRRTFPEAEPAVCAACARVTGGNPFLLVELLDKLREDEQAPAAGTEDQLAGVVPEKVRDAVGGRLQAMSGVTRTVAEALAVLGTSPSVRQVAILAELDPEMVSRAADELVAMNLLHPGSPLSFVHPLVRTAVNESLPPLEKAQAHRRAADILTEEHADAESIATHLLNAPPDSNPASVKSLREAATRALACGAAERAGRLLKRALSESPESEVRVELLAELGRAEAQAGIPQASERLSEARRISQDPRRRAELALAHGNALYANGRYRDAATALESGRAELEGDEVLAQELTAAYMSAASLVADLQGRASQLREEMLGALAGAPSANQRAAIAHTIVHDSLHGAPRKTIRALAELAWGTGDLVVLESPYNLSWPRLCAALLFTDDLEYMVEISDAVLAAGPPAGGTLRAYRASALFEQGRIAEAEANAKAALDAPLDVLPSLAQSAVAVTACCHIERGHLEHAEAVLAPLERQGSLGIPLFLEVRARLRLAQGRPRQALQDASRAGTILDSESVQTSPGAVPWRSTAALAHLALGDSKPALRLVEEELAIARLIGVTRIVIRDLRVLGLALGRSAGLRRLAEAVDVGGAYPVRLEYVRALVDLGAALRRAKRRGDAREPLRAGLDLSHKLGASVLAAGAQTELLAAGARPRRPALSGIDALTVSERRVAELAARGLSTRQVAEALFISPKTVEFHLSQTYRKLDIASREELADVLGSP